MASQTFLGLRWVLQRYRRTVGRVWPVLACLLLLLAQITVAGCSDPLSAARSAEATGDFEIAVTLYEERLQEAPDDLEALRALTTILFLQQRFDEVLPYQERLIALDPKDVQTRVELGFNYLNHQGMPAKAVGVFGEVVASAPSAKYLTFLAQAQIKAGDLEAAEVALRAAIKGDDAYLHAYRVLIALLEAEGRLADAAEVRILAFQKGLEAEAVDAALTRD